MKAKIIILLLVILSICSLKAQEAPSQHFQQAFEEISAMLDGKQPIDFEKAVFITENAHRDNSLNYEDFKSALNVHSAIIEQFIKANDKYDWKQFVRGNKGIAPDMEIEAKERYRKALANYAIFTYLTDTLTVKLEGQNLLHLPYTYSNEDPFGTADWKNSQTINLLETQKGNCYSLVTLFKIFSERFKSEANIVTAPQHIYIEHRDPKGSRFNVEVATRSFPDMGSIQTLTYTTREALLNDISMRKLNLKQSVGLNLVYLAKGYEYKNKVKDDEFILACANTALQHDPKNLNALLLKAQVYEQRVMKKQMPSAPYEKMLAEFYKLGYRQMPDDMKEIILSKIQGRPSTVTPTDKTPNTFADIGEQSRTVTLSNGLFEERHPLQKIVRYGQTIFDTEKGKVVKFLDEDNSSYQVDLVVFALSVDPLTKSYPELTPYQFASNTPIQAIDLDGLEQFKVIGQYHFGETQITINTPRTVQQEITYQFNFNSGRTDGFLSGLNPINQLKTFADFVQSRSTRNHYYIITDDKGTQYLVHPSEFQIDLSIEEQGYSDGYSKGFNEGGLAFDVATGFLGELNLGSSLFKVFKLSGRVDDLPTLTFTRSETPSIAENIDLAIKEGKPDVLTKEGSKAQQKINRAEALRGKRDLAIPGQTSLDEFPFASTKEGGAGSRVQAVPIGEQNIQGGKMSQFFQKNKIKDGDKFKVKVTN